MALFNIDNKLTGTTEEQIAKLNEKVSSLEEALSLSTSSDTVSSYVPITARAGYEFLDYSISSVSEGVALSWDGTSFKNSLTDGSTLEEFRVIIDSTKKTLVNENKSKVTNIILGSTDLVNSTIEVRAKIRTNDGIYRYESVQVLDLTSALDNGDKTIQLTPTIPTIQKTLTLEDVNSVLLAKIQDLQNQINSLKI